MDESDERVRSYPFHYRPNLEWWKASIRFILPMIHHTSRVERSDIGIGLNQPGLIYITADDKTPLAKKREEYNEARRKERERSKMRSRARRGQVA